MRDLPTGSASRRSVREGLIFLEALVQIARRKNCRNDAKQITRLQTERRNNEELILAAASHCITLFVVSFYYYYYYHYYNHYDY